MPVKYVETDAAIKASGLRMTVVSEVPSPWGEAAKGLLYFKGIDWLAVRLTPGDEAQTGWTGSQSAPVVMYNDEPPRHGWVDILMLAEKLGYAPGQVMAMGDGTNDIPMLRAAGHGVAMGNASPQVKAAAASVMAIMSATPRHAAPTASRSRRPRSRKGSNSS